MLTINPSKMGFDSMNILRITTFSPCLPLRFTTAAHELKNSNQVKHELIIHIGPNSLAISQTAMLSHLSQWKTKCRRSIDFFFFFPNESVVCWKLFIFLSCDGEMKVSHHAVQSLDAPTCPLVLTGLYYISESNEFAVCHVV